MSTVFLVNDLSHERRVALKVLRAELSASLGAQRFQREIHFSAQLQHPHILPVYDWGEAAGLLWYTMPYVEGESLRKWLTREPQLPLADALRITQEVAEALSYAHQHGVVHRDVKPENILVSGGQAMIADFGLARAIDAASVDRLTDTGLALGTPAYMSPEQSAGETRLDGRTDIYSLGCVLFEMLAGEPPYTGRTPHAIIARRLSEPLPHLGTLRDVPEQVERVVRQALARAPADRFATAAEFADALRRAPLEGLRPRATAGRRWPVGRLALVAVTVAAIGVAAMLLLRWTSGSPGRSLNPNLIAVAPFDIYDPGLDLWREGLMDILSANVDGAGALRTVSPSAIMRSWRGRSDAESAERLGNAVHAGVAVVGRLLRAGPDSVRAVVLVRDIVHRAPVGEVEVRESASRLDRLGDSLSIAILGLLGEHAGIRAQRLGSLGARSLSALKAFLQGEQYLRRARWDSAAVWYTRATALDSGFVLAHSRLKTALSWEVQALPDSVGDGHALYAGAHNVGLPPRDSLLIAADSLQASLSAEDSLTWQRTRRLFETLAEAARRYPSDPFVWYRIGEARYHLAPPLDYTSQDVLAAFDRAIALDSAFGPAYVIHPVELALIVGDARLARRYTSAYLRHAPAGLADSAMALTDLLLGRPEGGLPAEIKVASPDVLYRIGLTLDMWFDSSETALNVAREMVVKSPGVFTRHELSMRLARILSVRGHHEAAAREVMGATDLSEPPDGETVEFFTELALANAIPATVCRRTFAAWGRTSLRGAAFSLPWYAAQADTQALRASAGRADSMARSAATPRGRELARYVGAAARAYGALSRGDSATALHLFAMLPDSLCPDCYFDWKTRARLLYSAGQLNDSYRLATRVLTYAWTVPTYPETLAFLGELEERRGNREAAMRSYRTALDAWSRPDPSVLETRRAVESAMRRVTATR
jgi:serine/threonine-protein kinase